MAWNVTSPDLSNVELKHHKAEYNNFGGCKAVVNYSAENNTSTTFGAQVFFCAQN